MNESIIEWLKNISYGVVGNALWFILIGIAIFFTRSLMVNRTIRTTLSFKNKKDFRIVIGTPLGITRGEPKVSKSAGMPIIGYGPFIALNIISKMLVKAYPREKIEDPIPSRYVSEKDLFKNLILLGFPIGNEATKIIMGKMNLPFIFEGHEIYDTNKKEIVFKTKVEKNSVKEVYGMIVVSHNPLDKNKEVLILCGTETYGVISAARFIEPDNLDKIYGFKRRTNKYIVMLYRAVFFWRKNNYLIIVKSEISKHITAKPEMIIRVSL